MCDAAQAIPNWVCGDGGGGPVRQRLFECDNRLSVIDQQPGGTIGLISWTPEGFIGKLFATMKPYAPPPPPGASPPPLWGSEGHVAALFGDRVSALRMIRQTVHMNRCATPLEFREYWKRNYGPTIAAYRFTGEHPERVEALDRDFLEFLTVWNRSDDTGSTAYDAEYLLVTATKR